jgi:hypothetical protein
MARFAQIPVFAAAYAAVTLIAGAIYIRVVPSPDQSIFDYLAWLNIHGVPYYKGSFDMTWPGQLVFHELFVRIFGVHAWTARAGDLLLLQPAVLAIFLFLRRAGFPRAAIAAALVYPIIYATSGPWMAGHRDITGAHFLIAGSVFAFPSEKQYRWRPLIAGLLAGYAVMIRPTYLAFAPILFLRALPAWRGKQGGLPAFVSQALLFATGLTIPPLGFALYGLETGTLYDWYIDAIRFVFDVYPVALGMGRLFGMAATFLISTLWWLVLTGCAGGLLWFLFGGRREGLWLAVGMIATFLLSYFVQNKGFGYHLAGLVPVLVMLTTAGVEASLRTPLKSAAIRNGFGALVALLFLVGTGLRLAHARPTAPDWGRQEQERSLKLDDTLALVRIIRSESRPSDTLLQWGWEYQVSFLAERRSATRFVNTPASRLIRQGQPIFGEWLTEFDHELSQSPPKFILVDETVVPRGATLPVRITSNGDKVMIGIIERRVNRGYAIRAQRRGATLLERVDPAQ